MKINTIAVSILAFMATVAVSWADVPFITTQPANQTNTVGTAAVFSVAATSGSTVTYQWSFDGTSIVDATNSVLTLTNVQPSQAGSYSVALTNSDGSTNSATATLTVYLSSSSLFFDDFGGPSLNPMWTTNLPDAVCGSYPNGYPAPALYLGAPNFGFQTAGGNSVIRLTNTLAPLQRCGWGSVSNFVAGDFRYDVRFNTMIQSPATSIDGFVEIWIFDATNSARYDIISPFGGSYDGSPYFFVGSTIDNSFSQTSITYSNNTWYHLVLNAAAGQDIRASILNDDGTELVGRNLAHTASAYPNGFNIALSQVIGGAGAPYPVDVAVDYVNLTTGSAPVINTQPVNQSVAVGGTANFSVSAAGTAPLAYQWSFAGAAIDGATNSTLTLTNVQSSQSGSYSVEVANAYGAAFSSNAVLNTGYAPQFNNQPVSQTVAAGGTVTFTADVSGTAPLNYQWKYNGANLVGATTASLQLTNVQFAQSGNYSVFVSNAFGTVLSSNATLTIQSPPYMTSQPVSRTILVGGSVTFSASANGSAPLAYLWACNGTNISGATNPTLTLTNVQLSQAGNYVLTVTNAFGGIWSSNAILTVNGIRPSITNQPVSQTVPYGGSVTFSVVAGGTAPLNYQWTFGGTNISGATSSTLTLTSLQYTQAGSYAVVITNAFGSVTSSSATLTVISPLASNFFDDFSGTNLNPIWQTNLPNNAHSGSFPGYSQTATYLGGPNYGFQLLSGSSVLRLTNSLAPLQRRGWDSSTNFGGTNFYYEARFNTLNQSPTSSIDGFIEIWIIDAANSNRYDIISPFGGNYDAGTYFFAGSSIDNHYVNPSFTYSNYTWYRLVLQSAPGQNIRGSILNDAGVELIGVTFAHTAAAFPSGFKIGLSQTVGAAGATYPVDVAVDHVYLTTTYPPFITSQPTNQSVAVAGTATFNVTATGLAPLSYQWNFNGTNILGATNSTLVLTNVQLAGAGGYSVSITNSAGATNSAAANLSVISPITITQQPQSQTVLSYNSASFTVAASGNGTLSYQWLKNGTNLVDGGNVTGSATANLILSPVSVNDAGSYSVIVSDSYSSTNSSLAMLTVPETALSLGSTNAMSGRTFVIPVWMNALGYENAFLASVSYDPTKLALQSVTGTDLVPVYSQTNNGNVGFAIVLDPGATFAPGSNEVADLIFTALPVTNHVSVNLTFGDVPTGRQLVDNSFDSLPAVYSSATILISPAEYEADVYPRTNGDSQVNIFDWIEVGRMVAGLDVPTNSDEFLRADCAPRNAPDGALTVADWVQAGRYALGLDPLTLVTTPATPQNAAKFRPMGGSASTRILSVANVSAGRGQTVNVPVQLVCTSNENAAGFTVTYDTNYLHLVSVSVGANASGARLNVNTYRAGKAGIALALSPGTVLAFGTNQIAVLQFTTAVSQSGVTSLALDSSVVQQQVADNNACSLATTYVAGTVTLPPQPMVSVTSAAGGLQFNWPLASGTFQVQTANQPSGPWTSLVLPLVTNGANVSAACFPTNQQQFFRLQGQ